MPPSLVTRGAHVRVSTGVAGDQAILEVRDDGRGIALESRSQVFDPFFSTCLREGGSGLGLSVVHGIVTEHGGSIEIEVDLGTCVRIRFPIYAGREE